MLCDELVDGHYGVLSHISYLAPRTVVFMPRIPLSMKVYSNAGIVDKAGVLVSNLSIKSPNCSRVHTTKEQRQCRKSSIFCLKSFQQGRQRKQIEESVEEAGMNEWESIGPVHCADT